MIFFKMGIIFYWFSLDFFKSSVWDKDFGIGNIFGDLFKKFKWESEVEKRDIGIKFILMIRFLFWVIGV